RAILGTGNGLELYLDESVLDVGVVVEKQRVGSPTRLLDYLQFRRRRLVMFDRPFRIARAGPGSCPAFWSGANRVVLEADFGICHGTWSVSIAPQLRGLTAAVEIERIIEMPLPADGLMVIVALSGRQPLEAFGDRFQPGRLRGE